jgi:opacity protein-like surface antigen
MRRFGLGVLVIVAVMVQVSAAQAVDVDVVVLVEDGASFDGQTVTVTGELIGDYGSRRDGTTWTQLNQDSYAQSPVSEGGALSGSNVGIGVRIPTELMVGLDNPGRYRMVGPTVQVTGTWRFHDPQRSGESFLDVTTLVTVEAGRALTESPNWVSYGVGGLLILGSVLALGARTRARRQ